MEYCRMLLEKIPSSVCPLPSRLASKSNMDMAALSAASAAASSSIEKSSSPVLPPFFFFKPILKACMRCDADDMYSSAERRTSRESSSLACVDRRDLLAAGGSSAASGLLLIPLSGPFLMDVDGRLLGAEGALPPLDESFDDLASSALAALEAAAPTIGRRTGPPAGLEDIDGLRAGTLGLGGIFAAKSGHLQQSQRAHECRHHATIMRGTRGRLG